MKRKPTAAPDEVQYYDWRLSRWNMSETRERLDVVGRGIYRELLDHCYGQGEFPDDAGWISRKCACSVKDYKKWWPVIERHFPKHRREGYRHNMFADIWRRSYFERCEASRLSGKAGRKKQLETNSLAGHPRGTPVENGQNGRGTPGQKERQKERRNEHTPRDMQSALADKGREWLAGFAGRKAKPDDFHHRWISRVQSFEDCVKAFSCRDRYNASGEVARGVLKEAGNFIEEQADNHWAGEWPPPIETNGKGQPVKPFNRDDLDGYTELK